MILRDFEVKYFNKNITLRLVLYTMSTLVYRVRLLTFNFALWAFVYDAGVVGGSVSSFHFILRDLILYSVSTQAYNVFCVCGRACSTVI